MWDAFFLKHASHMLDAYITAHSEDQMSYGMQGRLADKPGRRLAVLSPQNALLLQEIAGLHLDHSIIRRASRRTKFCGACLECECTD